MMQPQSSARGLSATKVLLGLVALLIVGAAVAYWLPQQQPAPAAEVANPRTAWRLCQERVQAGLKAPSTAEFPAYDEHAMSSSGALWVVKSYVDADNSFGAHIRTRYECSATFAAGRWSVDSLKVD